MVINDVISWEWRKSDLDGFWVVMQSSDGSGVVYKQRFYIGMGIEGSRWSFEPSGGSGVVHE